MSSGLMLRARSGFQPVVLTAVVLIIALVQGIAGEPIIVGKEKPKTEVKESKFGKELSRPWEKVSPEAPISGLMFPIIPRSDTWDPKGDRKRKLQEREKKNWMSVMPGELQQEDEARNFLNVRQYEIEKEDESDNLMFRELDRNASQGNSRGQNRSGSQKENQNASPQRNDAENLERELAAKRAARAESRGESQLGAHTASELNFKGVFGTAPTEGKGSQFSLREVLGGSSAQQPTKSQQAMRDEFRAFLHGQPNGQGALSGSFNDPVNSSRGDLTRQPLNPAVGRPETHNDTFGGQASFAPQRQANPFAQGAFNNNSFSQQQGIPGFPTYTPTPPPTARPFQQAPPNNRGGMNSLGGHR
jgi:hypothetical protein